MLRPLQLPAALLTTLLSASLAHSDESPPNVLFIISDDLTAEALGCYGNEQCRTPHIDDLAGQGVRFTRAYCQFPVCGPSRAALMSGMYPQAIGVTGNGGSGRLTENLGDRPSMSQHFRNHGYYAARVSKIYHMRVPGDITAGVDGPDHADSWTERFNCQAPEWMTPGPFEMLTNERLNKDPDKHYGLGFGTAFYVVRGERDGMEQADIQAADRAIELLDAHQDEPFFLAVGLVRPHVPLVAPAPWFDPYPGRDMLLPERIADDWNDIPRAGISRNSEGTGLGGRRDRQRDVLAAYYACVSFMDAQVGRILEKLDQLGLRENTIVVFTSDHGYHLGEHDFWQKLSLHEESARIPLIVSAPGVTAAEEDCLAEQIDIYPTLAELGGLPIPEHCQGESLAGVMREGGSTERTAAWCTKGNGHLLRTDRWAYLVYNNGEAELYDMEADPQQITNLANDPAHRATRDKLQEMLDRKLERIRATE